MDAKPPPPAHIVTKIGLPADRTATQEKPPFDTRAFLSVSGVGRTVWSYEKNTVVFSQGDPAHSLLYIQ
jgi:hypothetical protein